MHNLLHNLLALWPWACLILGPLAILALFCCKRSGQLSERAEMMARSARTYTEAERRERDGWV